MGTDTTLKAVIRADQAERGRKALWAAESALRQVDERMSVWKGDSELSRFNAAPARRIMPLSADTLEVLRAARDFAAKSDGAFDVTCWPILQLWKRAEKEDRVPSSAEIQQVVDLTGWRWITLHEVGAEKLRDGVGIDLGGIAKGYAVDQAIRAMQKEGVDGGLVQCGGEIRVFGRPEHEGGWRVGIRNPFSNDRGTLSQALLLNDAAVSTSGDYERYFTICGIRRSHIVDPRNGSPVDNVAQATVVGATATISDGWSTALTILGPEGFERLPPGVEAMLIAGTEQNPQVTRTVGFEKLATGLRVPPPPVPAPRKSVCAQQKPPDSRADRAETHGSPR
jgi:thiamine biosynthesis lipoprotein